MIVLAIPTLFAALAPTLPQLIFWRFVQGLVLPPIFAVTIAYVGEEWPPNEATTAAGVYTSGASLGGFSGRFVTGIIADFVGLARRHDHARGRNADRRRRRRAVTAARKEVRALGGPCRIGAADVAALQESAAPCHLRGRLRRAVQFHRDVHLCQLPTSVAALQPVGDVARHYLRGVPVRLGGNATDWRRRRPLRPPPLYDRGYRDVDRRHLADAGAVPCLDRAGARAVRDLRPDLPGGFHRLCDHYRQSRAVVGGRPLRHQLLYRRQLRRRRWRSGMDVRRLGSVRSYGVRDAAGDGRGRCIRLDRPRACQARHRRRSSRPSLLSCASVAGSRRAIP